MAMEANPFHDARLAEIFDAIGESDRGDLEPYLAIVDELQPHTIIDLGSGTGVFACRLADLGKRVIGVEPGSASMDLARRQPGAARVQWILGDAAAMPDCDADLVTMTGNIPEHLTDEQWTAALAASHRALRPGGHLAFGNRPTDQAWLTSPDFAPRSSPGSQNRGSRAASTPSGPVHHWLEIIDLTPETFTFRWTFLVESDDTELTWETTFRRRTVDQIVEALEAASFSVTGLRDDHIFIARRAQRDSW
jgi:SAM-dependent methyltransferase